MACSGNGPLSRGPRYYVWVLEALGRFLGRPPPWEHGYGFTDGITGLRTPHWDGAAYLVRDSAVGLRAAEVTVSGGVAVRDDGGQRRPGVWDGGRREWWGRREGSGWGPGVRGYPTPRGTGAVGGFVGAKTFLDDAARRGVASSHGSDKSWKDKIDWSITELG